MSLHFNKVERVECNLGLGCECWMAYLKTRLYSFEERRFFLFKRYAWLWSVSPVILQYLANTSRNSQWGPEWDGQYCSQAVRGNDCHTMGVFCLSWWGVRGNILYVVGHWLDCQKQKLNLWFKKKSQNPRCGMCPEGHAVLMLPPSRRF